MAKRLLTPGYLTTAHRGLNAIFNKELTTDRGLPALHTVLCVATDSDGAEEEYDWMGDMPILREIQGEQTKRNLQSRQMVITNREFSALIGLKRATMERDKMNLYRPRIQQIGSAAKKWFDKRLFDRMVVNGWNAKYPDWTGTAYFNGTKPLGKDKKAATFNNAATAALSVSAYQDAVTNLRSRVDANGETMDLGDEGFTLVVGPGLAATAKKIVKAETVVDSGAGVTNVNAGESELRIWNRLTGTYANYWFLFAHATGRSPFIAQTEVPPATYMCTDPNDSYVIQNGEFLFQVYARGEVGPGESLLAYGSAV